MNGLSQWISVIVLSCLCASSVPAQEREGGITGTGILPAGISGTVTELGSIHVNGQHIRFATGMPVRDGVFLASAEDIRPGHTVAVVAEPTEDGWQALSIRQVVPLLGPVDKVGNGWLTIMGTRVVAADLTGDIAPGQWVAVSGLWRDREVVASRLEAVPSGAVPARIVGTAFPDPVTGETHIGGSVIGGIATQHLEPGEIAFAAGQPSGSGLRAERIEVGMFEAGVGVVQAEGYLSPPRAAGMYTLLGSGLVAYTDRPEMIDATERSLRCGHAGVLLSGALSAGNEALAASWARLGCE